MNDLFAVPRYEMDYTNLERIVMKIMSEVIVSRVALEIT